MYPQIAPLMQPMFGIPPPPPMPIPIAMPVPIAIRMETTSSSTTTTTEQSIAVAVPVPLPMPIQIAVPAMPPPAYCERRPRPYNCPPCPPCLCSPSCTPAFFSYCSTCHQKCRCRSSPPPIYKKRYNMKSSCSDESDSDSSSGSSSSSTEWSSARRTRKRRHKRKRLRNMRRNFQNSDMETSGGELVKPVLTYISRNGDIKFKKRISADEAAQLLGEKQSPKTHQNVKVIGGKDNQGKSQLLVVANDDEETSNVNRHRQIVLREGTAQNILGKGKKELIFRPPDDKRITNLSVSFQIVR